ncbi:TonB-dependent siderophore receptor [Acinetobacter baumannii]|uniref:TonB-dependent siderophore receptor n=1 Tax=Acinetobacter baumannii TaxID=470 RepID=UPI003FA472BF
MSSMLNKSTLAVFKRTALSLVVVGTLYSTSLYAQDIELNLPSQPLQQSIQQLARQSNVDILYFSENLKNKTAPQIKGKVSVERALHQLLQGTNLTAQKNGGVWNIVETPKNNQPVVSNVEKASEDIIQLTPIVVTAEQGKDVENNYTVRSNKSATKLDLSLKETPQSVTVITQKQMEDQNLTQALQVIEQTPGVIVEQNGVPGSGKMAYYSRGFAIDNIQIDNVPLRAGNIGPSMMSAFDTGVFERVDIVRGSTGLMSGIGDPSATINFGLKKPTDEVKGAIDVSYGTWNRIRSMFDVSGPLNEDKTFRGRAIAIHSEGDHWMDRIGTDTNTLYGALAFDFTPNTTLDLAALYSKNKTHDAAPIGPTLATVSPLTKEFTIHDISRTDNFASDWTYANAEYLNTFANLEHHFNDRWKTNLNYAYVDFDTDKAYAVLGGDKTGIRGFYHPEHDYASIDYGRETNDGKLHNLDISLTGKFNFLGQEQSFVIGANGYQGKLYIPNYGLFKETWGYAPISTWDNFYPEGGFLTGVGLPPDQRSNKELWYRAWEALFKDRWSWDEFQYLNSDLEYIKGYSKYKEKQYGAYFSTHLKPVDYISIILGGRYNTWERNYKIYDNVDLWNEPYSLDKYTLQTDYTYRDKGKFIPYAGILFDITPKVTTYFSYTGINKPQTDPYTMWDWQGNVLPAVEGNTMELGINAGFFEDRLNLHLAAYRMLQNNRACRTSVRDMRDGSEHGVNWYLKDTPLLPGYSIDPSVACDGYLVTGGEFTANGQITPNWLLSTSYSYAKEKTEKMDLRNSSWEIREDNQIHMVNNFGTWNNNLKYPQGYDNPEHLVKLFTTYKFLDKFTIGGSVIWRSETGPGEVYSYNGVATEPEILEKLQKSYQQKAFYLVDLMARYQVNQNLALGINVNNVTDETYRVNGNGSYFGAPRHVIASLQLRY